MLLNSPHFTLKPPFKRSRLIYGLLVSSQNALINSETLNLNGALESNPSLTEWEEESIFDRFKGVLKPLLNFGSFLNLGKEGESKLVNTYFILAALLLTCLAISFSIQSSTSWLKDFSLDLASEIIGILLVVFSVDRVIDAESQKKKKQRESVAVQQIKNAFIRHLYILYEIASNNPHASARAAKPSPNLTELSSQGSSTGKAPQGSLQLIYDKLQSKSLNRDNLSLEDIQIYRKQPSSFNLNHSNLDVIFTSYLHDLFKLTEVCY